MAMSPLLVALVVFVGFVLLLGGLALAVTRTVTPEGQTRRGALGGCAVALVLVLLLVLGFLGLGAFFLFMTAGAAVEMNPIESIELDSAPPSQPASEPLSAKPRNLYLSFEVRGDAGQELFEFVRQHVRHADVEWEETTRRVGEGGQEITRYTFVIPEGERSLYELEAEIEHELDGLQVRLPREARIEFRGIRAGDGD